MLFCQTQPLRCCIGQEPKLICAVIETESCTKKQFFFLSSTVIICARRTRFFHIISFFFMLSKHFITLYERETTHNGRKKTK